MKEVSELIMKIWNDKKLTNNEKFEIVKKLEEIEMIIMYGLNYKKELKE